LEISKRFLKKRLDGFCDLRYIGRYLSEFLPTNLRIEFLLRTREFLPVRHDL
jgi:hypothetical protein